MYGRCHDRSTTGPWNQDQDHADNSHADHSHAATSPAHINPAYVHSPLIPCRDDRGGSGGQLWQLLHARWF